MERTKDEKIGSLLIAKRNRDSQHLIDALVDPDVRWLAAAFLGDIEARDATPALLRLLSVAHPKTRTAATRALGRLDAVEAVPHLIELAVNDPDVAVRSHAIGALARLRDPRANPVLIDLLQDPNWIIRNDAVWALGSIGDETAIAPLQAAAAHRSLLRRRTYRKAVRSIRKRISS